MLVGEDRSQAAGARPQRRGLELFLWLLLPVILLAAHFMQILEQFSTVGCDGVCDLNLIFGARAAYPWMVAASIGVAAILAVILRLRGKPTYWAPLVGAALVLSSAISTSVLFQAGLAPMYDRNARITQGEVRAAPPPPDPVGSWVRKGSRTSVSLRMERSRATTDATT